MTLLLPDPATAQGQQMGLAVRFRSSQSGYGLIRASMGATTRDTTAWADGQRKTA